MLLLIRAIIVWFAISMIPTWRWTSKFRTDLLPTSNTSRCKLYTGCRKPGKCIA